MSKHWKVYILLRRPSSFPDNISRHIAAKYQIQDLWCWVSGLERVGDFYVLTGQGCFPILRGLGCFCVLSMLRCVCILRESGASVLSQGQGVCISAQGWGVSVSSQGQGASLSAKIWGGFLCTQGRVCLYPHRAGVFPYPHIACFWWMWENECSSYNVTSPIRVSQYP